MKAKRVTLPPDEESRKAATKRVRQARVKTLKHLSEIFERNDAINEVRRLKSEDQGF